jgi:hypothetical protein
MSSDTANCKHEFVRMFRRRLKGLERRLMSTKVYLPGGLKMGDFDHLDEGAYCFCVNCRCRLFPKKTRAEKERASLESKRQNYLGQTHSRPVGGMFEPFSAESTKGEIKLEISGTSSTLNDSIDSDLLEIESLDPELLELDNSAREPQEAAPDMSSQTIADSELLTDVEVDELEPEMVDFDDIEAEGVKLDDGLEDTETCDA